MKRISIIVALLVFGASASAKDFKAAGDFPKYEFTTKIANPITSVKDQSRSGTCWAFSAIGFVESEVIRINGIKDTLKYPDFSEFFIVSNSYSERAEKYVRLDGKLGFSAGSQADDVLDVIREHGLVPQEAMTGMNYGSEKPAQSELDAVLAAYVKAVASKPNKTSLTTAWKRGLDAVLDEYLGPKPESFKVDGKTFTPEKYRDYLKFNPDDYVTITSFTHHPFYTWFVLEVCDNWRWDESYNVKIDEFINILDHALENGYTAAWGTDVSCPGFTRDGYAILVDTKASDNAGSDKEHWVGKDVQPTEKSDSTVIKIVEKTVDQNTRQDLFDNKTTTDDHGMQIFGIAYDQFGKKYYMVKNSWGEAGQFKGVWYATEAFVRSQSMDIVLHKSALPKDFVRSHPNVIR